MAGALRELFNRITAVQENSRIAINISDFALGAGRGHESRVIREYPQVPGEMRNVEHVGSERAGHDVQISGSAGNGILEFVFRCGAHWKKTSGSRNERMAQG